MFTLLTQLIKLLNGKIMIKPKRIILLPILAVQTTYKCNMLCGNCYLGDMLNNPKFADVDVKNLKKYLKNYLKEQILDLLV